MFVIRTSLFLVLSIIFSGLGTEETLEQHLENQLRRMMKKHHLPGFAISIVEDQNILFEEAMGYADLERKKEVSSTSIFKVWSVSKLFTALEIFREVEEGLVKLDDPLIKYLPNFSIQIDFGENDQITIRSILAHQSGLPRNECLKVPLFEGQTGSLDRFEIGTWDCIQATPSGTRYKYSNLGYDLLGRVIEENRKAGYAQYMRDEFLNSLGMRNTTFDSGDITDKERLVLGYHYHKRNYQPMVQNDISSVPSGNMYSTLEDLTTFMQCVFRNDLFLNESTLREMFKTHYNTSRNPETMGLGWKTTRFRDTELLVWHDGGPGEGIGALIVILPDRNIGIAMAANSTAFGGAQSLQLATGILDRILGDGEITVSENADNSQTSIDPALLERYEGNYAAWGSFMQVKAKKGKLKGKIGGFGLSLIPLNENQFRVSHWMDRIGLITLFKLPMDLQKIRISFYTNTSLEPELMIINMDNFSYEICPLYPANLRLPEVMQDLAGDYKMAWRLPDNEPGPLSESSFTIGFEDQVLTMSGVFGPLLPVDEQHLTILSGPFAGEIMEYDAPTGRLLHQNGIFLPANF